MGDIIGKFIPIEEKFTAYKYLDILLRCQVLEQYIFPEIIYLVKDNSLIHKAKVVQS